MSVRRAAPRTRRQNDAPTPPTREEQAEIDAVRERLLAERLARGKPVMNWPRDAALTRLESNPEIGDAQPAAETPCGAGNLVDLRARRAAPVAKMQERIAAYLARPKGAGKPADGAPRRPVTVIDRLRDEHAWCAFEFWPPKPGETQRRKVPYVRRDKAGIKHDGSAKLLTFAEAQALFDVLAAMTADERQHIKVPKAFGGGVGLVAGAKLGDGRLVAIIDLDSCVAPDGSPYPWASEAMQRIGGYWERSPSATGFRGVGLIRAEDMATILPAWGNKVQISGKRPSSEPHPEGFEAYLANKFGTITGDVVPYGDDRVEFNSVVLRALATELRPRLVGEAPKGKEKSGVRWPAQTDFTRSGRAMSVARTAHNRHEFRDEAGMRAFLLHHSDPEIVEWATDDHQVSNLWQKLSGDFARNHQGGILPNNQNNVRRGLDQLGVVLSYDLFAGRHLIAGPDDAVGRFLDDAEMIALRMRIDDEFGFRPEKDFFFDVIGNEARKNGFHPVCDYLDRLKWDGKQRIDRWLETYGGAEDNEYTRAVGRLILVAACRRVRQPGCKFDEMVVLESPQQGLDKSEALRVLAVNDDWFSDSLSLNTDDKRVIEQLRGRWIVEFAELAGMRKGDIEGLKAFLSRRIDRARLAYGRTTTELPRQVVFFGSTNSDRYLRDQTGNRRFWPVRIKRFDTEALRRDRDQLWAEASAAEASGETIRLDPQLYAVAGIEQAARTVIDPWQETIADAFGDKHGKLPVKDAWKILNVPVERRDQLNNERLGAAMRANGWERKQLRVRGKAGWCYWRPPADGSDPAGKRLPLLQIDREDDGHVMVRAFADGEDEG